MGLSMNRCPEAGLSLCSNTCPAKRLTPMGLLAGESARGLCDFRWEVGAFIGAAGCDGVIGGRDCMVFCGFIR